MRVGAVFFLILTYPSVAFKGFPARRLEALPLKSCRFASVISGGFHILLFEISNASEGRLLHPNTSPILRTYQTPTKRATTLMVIT